MVRLRVFFDYQMFSTHARGGIAKYFAQLATHMSCAGWQTYLPFKFCLNQHYFEMGGRHLVRFPSLGGSRRIVRVESVDAHQDQSKFDVWHSTYFDATLIERYGSDRLVTTIYDMIPEQFPTPGQNYYSEPIIERPKEVPTVGKEIYARKSKRIIAISNKTREDVCKYMESINPRLKSYTAASIWPARRCGRWCCRRDTFCSSAIAAAIRISTDCLSHSGN